MPILLGLALILWILWPLIKQVAAHLKLWWDCREPK